MLFVDFSDKIKQKALDIGFSDVGIVTPQLLQREYEALLSYLRSGYNANLNFLQKKTHQRKDISQLFPNVRSIIMVIASYFPIQKQPKETYQISYYTYSNDYHYVLKSNLIKLWTYIKNNCPNAEGDIFVDTKPIFEKAYASLAGLGWIGKNTLLIHPNFGSYVFIGGIMTNLNLETDSISCNQRCPDNCNLCIEACPVNAIEQPYLLNASKCISYFTIENKDIELEQTNPTNYIAGCDICQQVCPINKHAKPEHNQWFLPNDYVFWNNNHWETLQSNQFNRVFRHTVFRRIGFKYLKRNISWVTK
ncbi:MAG: tRNA epoxyqueuosine(34) reductase QueG [Bacteroidales bacterium]|nr:tRNA epoxyqueuosine(34) reductase QueG [Bacteroidales bacterium]